MTKFVRSMFGLGDNIYQRAFVRQLGECWISTPWPELYADLPGVHFVPAQTRLRTQNKNIQAQDASRYSPPPRIIRRQIRPSYDTRGIIPGMIRAFGCRPGAYDLPDFGQAPYDEPYAVVRPVTVRKEWPAASRNPLPEYVNDAAWSLMQAGYKVISVADLQDGQEWPVGELPPADIRLHNGELNVSQLMALIKGASAVVGGVGWIVPACVAANVPALVICGGYGAYNRPDKITHGSMRLDRMTFAVPDRFCECREKSHDCDKRISTFDQQLGSWLLSLAS